jgi:hypothetical protein
MEDDFLLRNSFNSYPTTILLDSGIETTSKGFHLGFKYERVMKGAPGEELNEMLLNSIQPPMD